MSEAIRVLVDWNFAVRIYIYILTSTVYISTHVWSVNKEQVYIEPKIHNASLLPLP